MQECLSEDPDLLLWTPALGPLELGAPAGNHELLNSPPGIGLADLPPAQSIGLHERVAWSEPKAESATCTCGPPLDGLGTPLLMQMPLPGGTSSVYWNLALSIA